MTDSASGRGPSMRSPAWPVAATTVGAVVATLMTPWVAVPERPLSVPWWAVAIGFALAELMVLHLPLRTDESVVTVVEIPLAVSLALASPAGLIIGRLLGTGAAHATKRPDGPISPTVTLAGRYVETVAAIAVYGFALGDAVPIDPRGWGAAMAGILAAFAVRRALALAALPASRRADALDGSATRLTAIATTGLIGVVTLILLWTDPLSVVVVASLTGSGYMALHWYGTLTRRNADLEALIGLTAMLREDDPPADAAGRVLAGVCAHLGTVTAALVAVDGDAGRAIVEHAGSQIVAAVDPGEVDALLAAARPSGDLAAVLSGDDCSMITRLTGGRPDDGLAVPLSGGSPPTGVLVAAGRSRCEPFDRHDRRFFGALGGLAGATLDRTRLIERLREEVSVREHQALHDALTGLPNRRQFLAATARALENAGAGTLAVLTLDVDRFKDVNDTLGHEEGDRLICDVAQRVGAALRPSDTVARLGGDEFAVLVQVGDPADAVGVARRIEEALRRPFHRAGIDIEITASTGIALTTGRADGAATLLQHADIAMFAAKAAGLSHEVYAPELDHYSPRRLVLAGELRNGIAACEITAHYQPKIRVDDRRVVGAEALARWISPIHGEVSPTEFIPIAEKTGLIRPLTNAVLRQAVAASVRWRDAGNPIGIAVNISPRNLLDPDFVESVAEVISAGRADPASITFEITEGSVLHDSGRAATVLTRIAELGIGVSVDDFGTGYSSLGYLKRLPVTEVKIDRTFVMRMDIDAADRAIVDSTIQLAHRLGLRVVAEGVESAHVLDMLEVAGCDLAQGFHIARPMPEGAFRTWLADWQRRDATVTPLRGAGRRSPAAAS